MSIKSLCEQKVFADVFMNYSKTLHNYLYYKIGDEAMAKDLTQDAFLKLWQNCKKVSFETAKGYVFMVAKNQMLNKIKHQQVKLKFESLPRSGSTNESPEFLLEEKEFKSKLNEAISNLPEKQRVVFLMSRIDKMTYQEIADTIGISKKAVEKRIYNALDQLRKFNKNIK